MLAPYLGVSALYGFTRDKQSSYIYSSKIDIKVTHLYMAVQAAIVPGVQYNLSDRIHLDFNVPITLMRFSYFYNKYINPTQTNGKDHYSYSDAFSFFKKDYMIARLGLGINLQSIEFHEYSKEKFIKTIRINSDLNINTAGKAVYSFENFTPVLTFLNKRNFSMHEIDLNPLSTSKYSFVAGGTGKYYRLRARYTFKYFFRHKSDVVIAPYAGISADLDYSDYLFKNNQAPEENYSWQDLSYSNAIIPGFQINPAWRIYVDLSCPLTFLLSGTEKNQAADPAQNKVGTYSYGILFPKMNNLGFKLGLGYKL
ncbi:MAG: hypothetical protein K2X86_02390 [Cytophagaceae bacterium]|nr:hypothetical protein [Cytophagaceae bacterium]